MLIKFKLHIILRRRYKCKASRVFIFALSGGKGGGNKRKKFIYKNKKVSGFIASFFNWN